MKKTALLIFNLLAFIFLTAAVCIISWHLVGRDYIFASKPVGGDYFNAITYANFFKNHLPFPPQGWVPFWNEGEAVIGGYPFFVFYLITPLTNYLDIASAMELVSAISLGLFFVFSLLLFRQVSKNWILSFGLTIVLIATKATYYPLLTGGFISSATVQWYLPLSLFLIYKFADTKRNFYLVLASIVTGIALIHHGPVSLLMVLLPCFVVLALMPQLGRSIKARVFTGATFLGLSSLIGSIGLYSVFLQTYLGSGTSVCTSPQCWGIYPKHLTIWLNPIPPILISIFLILLAILIQFKKKINPLIIIPPLGGLLIFVLYATAAYLHLISGPANVIFPTRTFWVANFFMLLVAAALFRVISKSSILYSFPIALVVALGISFYAFTNFPLIHKDFTATDPIDAAIYTIDKYKSHSLSELVPEWIDLNEQNWRMDTFNPGLTHWWNFVSKMPSTRGYSNHPIGIHKDYQYFLQTATRNPEVENEELTKNQAHFLLDGFGIGYRENSIAPYPQSILNDPKLITKNESKRGFNWYQLSPDIFTPIVYPTNSKPLLFIGDEIGYQTFIRAIAMVNLNSRVLIPVKGPENVGSLTDEELKIFPGLILYRFSGNNFSKLENYVKNGGFVFIETAGNNSFNGNKAQILPSSMLETKDVKGDWNATAESGSKILSNVAVKEFSPLQFENGSWKTSTFSEKTANSWVKPSIKQKDSVLIASGNLGKGTISWSGVNLIFHIVNNTNLEEAKMFKNLLLSFMDETPGQTNSSLTEDKKQINEVKILRPEPEKITVNGKNFKGIYFKENYNSGWKATTNRSSSKVYEAGLSFMYVPVTSLNPEEKTEVMLEYKGNYLTWLIFFLSIISLILTVIYLIVPRPFIFIKEKLSGVFKKNLVKLVHEEE